MVKNSSFLNIARVSDGQGLVAQGLVAQGKAAQANWETLIKVFTVPEGEESTLTKLEAEVSNNIDGFLKQHVVAGDLSPDLIEKQFQDTAIPEEPSFVSDHAHFILDHIVRQSVHVSSPAFVGHMTSALPYFTLPLAKIMIALNQNLVKIETSKAFTPLERQLIGMIHRLIYELPESFYSSYTQEAENALGIFCSGGTVANITALWAARNKMLGQQGSFPGVKQAGLIAALKHYGHQNLAILVSERSHYSLKKAADLIGIGRDQCIAVPTDANNKLCLTSLQKKIAELRASGIGILSVVGIAGTTETGSVDPLDSIADICQEQGIHFHVDAAWGGPTLLSRLHKGILKGIERADSVTFDAHKQLYVPMGAGLVLFRDPHLASGIENHANYIVRRGSRDLGRHSLEGSRPGMALLVHATLKIIGRRGFEILINHGISMARNFAALIESRPRFELVTRPELNLLCYRYQPEGIAERLEKASPAERELINLRMNELTVAIQKTQRSRGKTFVSRTTIPVARYARQDITVFRVVLANPLTTIEILKDILDEQEEIGAKILAEKRFRDLR